MPVNLGFTGDVMLGRLVDEQQRSRPVTAVWGTVLDRLVALDGLFVNLECCIATRGQPWRRTQRAFHFRADPAWAIPALQRATVDCCGLANNHVLDFEVEALEDTLDNLDDGGIAHAGAGRTLESALDPAHVTVEGLDVAFVSLTDNTPEYAATEESPGTAHVEIDVTDEQTRATVADVLDRAMQRDPDLLVCSLHWGPNMRTVPPEAFREFAHRLVDSGVDVVHGHSAHVFQAVEVYDGQPILYDAGDFVDDYAVDDELRNDLSFLFELLVTTDGDVVELRLHPTEIDGFAVHEASPTAAEWCQETMRDRSAAFETAFERDGDRLRVELGANSA